eukprot:Skav216484  [mRNA]  locus=scaffold1123:424120:426245:- [translate_table: standard]
MTLAALAVVAFGLKQLWSQITGVCGDHARGREAWQKPQTKETTEEKPKESGGLLDEEDEHALSSGPSRETPAPGTSEAKQWEEDWDDAGWDDEDQDQHPTAPTVGYSENAARHVTTATQCTSSALMGIISES